MRLFIGFPLSQDAADDTAHIAGHCALDIPGRYSFPENYHMTLAFLGEVPPEDQCKAEEALHAFASQFSAPRLTLGALSYFRQAQNAVLIRTVSSTDALDAMHAELIRQLDLRTLAHTDGPFSPHVTLARHADVSKADLQTYVFSHISYTAHHAALYLSARDDQNILRYTPIATAPFLPFP